MSKNQTTVSETKVDETAVKKTKVKKTKVVLTSVFKTMVEMTQEYDARKRVAMISQKKPKGKMFQVSFNQETFFVIALNQFRAQGLVLSHLGSKVKRIKPTKTEDVLDLLKSLTPEQIALLKKSM